MDPQILSNIAARPVEINPTYQDVPVTYFGSQVPLHGMARIGTTRERLSAEIDDVEHWEMQMLAAQPAGTAIELGQLFRTVAPGRLIGQEGQGRIVPDAGGWEAQDVYYVGQSGAFGLNDKPSTFRFLISSLEVHGPAYGRPVAATRLIDAGGEWSHVTRFDDRPVIVRALSTDAASIDEETLAITIDGQLDEIDSKALWLFASFVSGNRCGGLLTELYADDGALILQRHRRAPVEAERHQFWRPYYASFSAEGMQAAIDGIARLLRKPFPIENVMEHMFLAATGNVDVDAIHLVLAAHTAIEAWNRAKGIEAWICGRPWARFVSHILGDLVPEDLYDSIGSEMKENIRGSLSNANRTTTGWRQRQLYHALGIDVSGKNAKRILKMRNELLHNGYFLTRWSELSQEDQQRRRDDVERLRRLSLFIVFRLIGYYGAFLDPITFQPQTMPRQEEANVAP